MSDDLKRLAPGSFVWAMWQVIEGKPVQLDGWDRSLNLRLDPDGDPRLFDEENNRSSFLPRSREVTGKWKLYEKPLSLTFAAAELQRKGGGTLRHRGSGITFRVTKALADSDEWEVLP